MYYLTLDNNVNERHGKEEEKKASNPKPNPNVNGDILLIVDYNQNDIQYRYKSQFIRKRRIEYLKLKGQQKKGRMKKKEQVATKVLVKQQEDSTATSNSMKRSLTNSEKCAREKVKSLIITTATKNTTEDEKIK